MESTYDSIGVRCDREKLSVEDVLEILRDGDVSDLEDIDNQDEIETEIHAFNTNYSTGKYRPIIVLRYYITLVYVFS